MFYTISNRQNVITFIKLVRCHCSGGTIARVFRIHLIDNSSFMFFFTSTSIVRQPHSTYAIIYINWVLDGELPGCTTS